MVVALCGWGVGTGWGAPPAMVRFATYNVSFFRGAAGVLVGELRDGAGTSVNHGKMRRVAEVLQRVRPDVVLLNEFDYDVGGEAVALFRENFLAVPQGAGLEGMAYEYSYSGPVNTGVRSGWDLDNDGRAVGEEGSEAYGNDCFGFGLFPGQYGMVIYSRFPIEAEQVRRFQLFLWKDLPGSQLLRAEGSPALTGYYSEGEREQLRLSSKAHVDVPIDLGGGVMVHLLASHPTPPTFDGVENKNGKRNFDEIKFWADYVDPGRGAGLYDDAGKRGGLAAGARFVVVGDQNADPHDGESLGGAARQLTQHPLINGSFIPSSGASGGALSFPGGVGQVGSKSQDTAAFSGGLRVDYVLPSRAGFSIYNGAVIWPGPTEPLRGLVSDREPSDHHLVWVEVRPQISLGEAVRDWGVERVGDGVRLSWRGAAGYRYRVQQSGDLRVGSWVDSGVEPEVGVGEGRLGALVGVPAGGRMYYRLEVRFAP